MRLNSFIRVFSAVPIVSDNGEHVGGYIGFLRSIAKTIGMFKPTRCIIVFDGKGGSARRKSMYSGYKEGRSVSSKFNRYDGLSDYTMEEELASMRDQMGRLIEYLSVLPVTMISMDNIEADDTIAILTTEVFRPKGSKVTIMSDDKDFLQLVTDDISVWRPVEKKLYTPKEVVDRFIVPPHNFVHYKAFMGDGSDNIKGVNGIGIKTLQSKLPIIFGEDTVDLNDVLEYCEQHKADHKIYEKILDSKDILELNWKLMNLEDLQISPSIKSRIHELSESVNELNTTMLKSLFIRDRTNMFITNLDLWLRQGFGALEGYSNIVK